MRMYICIDMINGIVNIQIQMLIIETTIKKLKREAEKSVLNILSQI